MANRPDPSERDVASKITHELLAGALINKDPEIAQAVTAAALYYVSENFEAFCEEIGFKGAERRYVRQMIASLALLTGNGAQALRDKREKSLDDVS
jgi:hypothetical protein